jgi:hypothetical protein
VALIHHHVLPVVARQRLDVRHHDLVRGHDAGEGGASRAWT